MTVSVCFVVSCRGLVLLRLIWNAVTHASGREQQNGIVWSVLSMYSSIATLAALHFVSLYRCGMDIAPNPGLMPKKLDIDNREDSSFLIGSEDVICYTAFSGWIMDLNPGFISWSRRESKSAMVQIRVLSVQQHTTFLSGTDTLFCWVVQCAPRQPLYQINQWITNEAEWSTYCQWATNYSVEFTDSHKPHTSKIYPIWRRMEDKIKKKKGTKGNTEWMTFFEFMVLPHIINGGWRAIRWVEWPPNAMIPRCPCNLPFYLRLMCWVYFNREIY